VSDFSVLILGDDSAELGGLIAANAELSIPVTVCRDAADATAAYKDQSILLGDPVSIAHILADMPTVKWVQSTWAGVTPLLEIERRDYVLTGIKDVFGPQMSEYVLGYMLAHELRITERLTEQRSHQWCESASGTLLGKKIGVMGTGSIGEAIASRAHRNGMVVTGLSRSGRPNSTFEDVYTTADMAGFLSELDYLVSVLPDTPETDNLLDEASLAHLSSHACFINVGRANVVDDDALIQALNSNALGGAVLDVFDEEPVPEDSPLWDTPNLLMTPHIAAISHPELIVPIFLQNYERFITGRTLMNLIDFEHGY